MSELPPDVAVEQIAQLLDRERYDSARKLLGPALAKSPDDTRLLLQAAILEIGTDRIDEAGKVLSRLLELDPEDAPARYLLFQVLIEKNRHAEVEKVILQLLAEEPEDDGYYAAYARLMLVTLRFEKCLKLADEALRLNPASEEALAMRVCCGIVTNRRETARISLEEMLQNYPSSSFTLTTLLAALLDSGRYREANELAGQLLAAKPADEDLVSICINTRVLSHWTMLPLYPIHRWGYLGMAFAWIGLIVAMSVLVKYSPAVAGVVALVYFVFVVYSWTYPPLLRRWLRRRGW